MAGTMSDYLETACLNHFLKGSSYSQPAHLYVALFTVAPARDGTGGTEVTGNGYARQICDSWTISGAEPAGAVNAVDVIFPPATPAGYGTIVAWALYDQLSGGNMLYMQSSSTGFTQQTIPANGIAKFLAGALALTQT